MAPKSMTASTRVAFPPELHTCVNGFLSQANDLHKTYTYDAVSASLLYAAARYNVHGFLQQDDARHISREDFVQYMVDLYRRMLDENLETGTTESSTLS